MESTNNLTNFEVFLTHDYIGSFNYATDPYSDTRGINLNEIKAYTDNGIAELYSSQDFTNIVGQLMYTDNYINIKLINQQNIKTYNIQHAYFFPNGIINTIGSVYNEYDETGYQIPGTKIVLNIVGGSGSYINAKGKVLLDCINDNLLKTTFYFE